LPEKLAGQAETYRQVFATCLQAANCKAFLTWGLTDAHSWIPGSTGNPDIPLLFDEHYQPKPAYQALIDLLNK
jgi:endo-1,4-beta-xylanase